MRPQVLSTQSQKQDDGVGPKAKNKMAAMRSSRWRQVCIILKSTAEDVYNNKKDGSKMAAGLYNIKKDGGRCYNIKKDGSKIAASHNLRCR